MPKYFVICILLLLTDCVSLRTVTPRPNGLFFVSGDLTSRINERCELHIIVGKEPVARARNIRPVTGNFEESFLVSALRAEYAIDIRCNNNVIHQSSVKYPGTLGYGGSVQLGKLG